MALIFGIGILISIVSIFLTFKAQWFIFYFGIGALALQLLLFVKWFDIIYGSFSNLPAYLGVLTHMNLGLVWAFIAAISPFPIPLGAAYLVGSITVDPELGVKSFFFFSLVQVILLGFTVRTTEKMERNLKAITGYAIPLLTFLITVVNLFLPENQQLGGFDSVGNLMIFISLCCCLTLVFIIFIITLFFLSKRDKR